jgi:phage terminase large subunit-like protein
MHELYEYGKQIAAGLRSDPEFGFLWYEAHPDAAVDDRDGWYKAQPALGLIVPEEFYAKTARAVLSGKFPEFMFRRLYLNQWTSAAERWLPWKAVEQCGGAVEIPDGADIYLALDAALSRDSFAVVMVHVADGLGVDAETLVLHETTVAHVRGKAFIPPENEYIDPGEVETYVLGLASRYNILQVSYDPAYMGLLASSLADRGLPMEPFPQTADRMTEATETFQRLFLDARVRHGGERMLLNQIANIGTKPTERGVRISKIKSSGGRVDLPVALAMALQDALGDAESEFVFEVSE